MKYVLIADCQDAPQALALAAGPRSVTEIFPVAINNPFRVSNPGTDGGRMIPAKFSKNSGLIITGVRLDFLGAPGLQPGILPPQGAAADCVIQIGTKTLNISFAEFDEWIWVNIPVSSAAADPINEMQIFWNGAAPIGRCRVVYDALNLAPVYFGADFVAQLSLEIEVSSEVLP